MSQPVPQILAPEIEQRAQPEHPFGLAARGHCREPVDPGAAHQPHQQGFGLIVARMAKRHCRKPLRPRPVGEQPQPRPPRPVHQVAAAAAIPSQNRMIEAERRCRLSCRRCLRRRFRAQAVIDRGRCQPDIPASGPTGGKLHERDRIAPAGQRNAETRKPARQPVERGEGGSFQRVGISLHPPPPPRGRPRPRRRERLRRLRVHRGSGGSVRPDRGRHRRACRAPP